MKHGWNGEPGNASEQPRAAASAWNHEIHLQPLLIAEEVQLAPASGIDLGLYDFRGHEPFEKRSPERRLRQLGLGLYSQQMAGKPGIGDVDLGGLQDSLPDILEIRLRTTAGNARAARRTCLSMSLRTYFIVAVAVSDLYGATAIISPSGKTMAGSPGRPVMISADVPLGSGWTVYNRAGYLLRWLFLPAFLASVVFGLISSKRRACTPHE